MGILGSIVKSLTNSFMDKAIEMQKSNPEFKHYLSKYSHLSKEDLLEEMRHVDDPTAKAALGYLARKK